MTNPLPSLTIPPLPPTLQTFRPPPTLETFRLPPTLRAFETPPTVQTFRPLDIFTEQEKIQIANKFFAGSIERNLQVMNDLRDRAHPLTAPIDNFTIMVCIGLWLSTIAAALLVSKTELAKKYKVTIVLAGAAAILLFAIVYPPLSGCACIIVIIFGGEDPPPSSPSYIDKKPLPRLDLPKSQLGNDDLTTQAMERFEAWLEAYHERRNRRWIEAYNENLHRRPPLPPVVPVHSPDP